MESFIKRKRKATPTDDQTTIPGGHVEVADDEPTEVKLAILSSLHPDFSQEALLDILLEHDGSVAATSVMAHYIFYKAPTYHSPPQYLYNGARLTDVRKITPYLDKVKPLVQKAVNAEIQERIRTRCPGGVKLKHQSPGPWTPNAAFVNCYNGPGESVGWHSDQLTYLGPRAVIGSLSLGVAREFRVRRVVPKDEGTGGGGSSSSSSNAKKDADGDAGGQIAIHLPHNSLLVMHAEMQEEWKHSIAPAQAIDPHPVAGNRRINVTYRDYKASLHPSRTPKCRCGVPTVLRVVQKKKENWGRYFWMCHAGNVPGKDGCTFFQWAEFDDDGNPIWRGKGAASPQRPNDHAEN
ncbi:hypothetical protein SLS64_011852 [Diaporthe eres]